MPKIITDAKKIDEVLRRGVEIIYPEKKELRKKLTSGKKLKIYCGFDPTAPSLHIGHLISINKLGQLQKLGHEIIFLIGDFTGMIGDPTDKTSARQQLTREQVLANCQNYQKQASVALDFSGPNPAKVLYNSEWLGKLTFRDLIEISSHFTVQQMIQRDMFQVRLAKKRPIYMHEFLYPLAQGYDSVAMDIDIEVGGNDQMFNMMAGRDLMKAMKGKEKFVMTLKLLADDKGKKMGKSEGNAVNLDEEPANIYGKIMSWPDGVIGVGFELCTDLDWDQVKEIQQELKNKNTNPRDLKMRLAYEITRLIHGQAKARQAEDDFVKKFQKKDQAHIKTQAPAVRLKISAPSVQVVTFWDLVSVLTEHGLVASKAEAKRLIKQGAIKVEGQVIKDINQKIPVNPDGVLIQRGKKKAIKVMFS